MEDRSAARNDGGEGADEIVRLLAEVRADVPGARDRLFAALYVEIRRCAIAHMERQPVGHTLQATALVHLVFDRLRSTSSGPWNDREHYLRVASTAMHQILVDHARGKAAKKREAKRVELLDNVLMSFESRDIDIARLDEVMEKLRTMSPPMADAALLLIYTSATMEEAAKAAGQPLRTFERSWKVTAAWIKEQLG